MMLTVYSMEPPPSPKPSFVRNSNLAQMSEDFLYHLSLDTKNYDLKDMFKDVKVSSWFNL